MENKPTPQTPNQGNLNLNIDTTPVFYTDFVNWNITPDGVVLNFGQAIMGSNQIKITSRVGLGRDFLKRFIGDLGKMVALTEGQGQTGKPKS